MCCPLSHTGTRTRLWWLLWKLWLLWLLVLLLLLLFRTRLNEGAMCVSTLPNDANWQNPSAGHLGVKLPATPAPPALDDQQLVIIENSKKILRHRGLHKKTIKTH